MVDYPDYIEDTDPIDMLKPDGANDHHKLIVEYLTSRLKDSEDAMGKFYDRWRDNERMMQAYIELPDEQRSLDRNNKSNKPAKAVNIVVPYAFATISTIITYLIQTFAGRRPIFTVTSYKSSTSMSSQNMETILQYQADHNRFIKHLFQFLSDSQVYGVGIFKVIWEVDKAKRTVVNSSNTSGETLGVDLSTKTKARVEKIVYEGNKISTIDPFMFRPDPRVPMCEVNKRGEYVFWGEYQGMHWLKTQAKQGIFKYVNEINNDQSPHLAGIVSDRNLRAGGESNPSRTAGTGKGYKLVEQGTIEIIPKTLGLGKEDYPVKYLFTIVDRATIVQCEEFDTDHDMHPVAVTEPYTQGYGFGNCGMADYLEPIQNTLSWLVNSHMDNIKAALNNMWVVDPSRIEMQDLKKPGPGKLIRAKASAYGQDVRQSLTQLDVRDYTRQHMQDFESFMQMGNALTGVNDNLRGIQASGGRKTATEVRTAVEGGASRLAATAKLISAQAFTDLTEIASLNNQQFLSKEFLVNILGVDDAEEYENVSLESIIGDFNYPIHDGTLPIDKIAMVDVWKEIFIGIQQDEQLRSEYSMGRIFEHIAELGGVKNIENFKLNSQEQIEAKVSQGQLQPLANQSSPSGNINANPVDASRRLSGALV